MKKTLIVIMTIGLLIFLNNTHFVVSASEEIAIEKGGAIQNVKVLRDNSETNRFTLYEFVAGGYLIYDNQNEMISEYSTKSKSPYNEKSDNLYYYGPTKYIYKDGSKAIDIISSKEVNLKFYTNVHIMNSTEKNSMKYTRTSSTFEVPYSFYFKKLDGEVNDFPANDGDDCGFVASVILLSYLEAFYNLGYVDSQFISSVNNTSFDIDEWDYVPCASEAFKNLLKTYHAISDTSIAHSISIALNTYADIHISQTSFYSRVMLTPIYDSIVTNMCQYNTPIILFGNYDNSDLNEYVQNHAIIAYGYNNSDGNYLLTHFGWESTSQVWIQYPINLADKTIVGSTYQIIELEDNHTHSDLFNVNFHKFCPYDLSHTEAYEYSSYVYDTSSQHKILCTCGHIAGYESHDYVLYLSESDTSTYVVPIGPMICTKCEHVKMPEL